MQHTTHQTLFDLQHPNYLALYPMFPLHAHHTQKFHLHHHYNDQHNKIQHMNQASKPIPRSVTRRTFIIVQTLGSIQNSIQYYISNITLWKNGLRLLSFLIKIEAY